MKFAYPEFLWAFFILIIPIVIHLFNFRKFKTVYFSNISFLKEVKEETKSRSKLKHLLILISRLLAWSFLILAFAKPYLPENSEEDIKLTNIVSIYIDNSFSMNAAGESGDLLNMGKEYAENIVNSYTNNDRFQIISNNLEGEQRRILTKQEAVDEIYKIQTSPVHRNLSGVFSFQNEALKKEKVNGESNLHFYWISDFQKTSSDFDEIKEDGNVSILKLNATKKANVFVDSVWFETPLSKGRTQLELKFRVQNSSEEDLSSVEVSLVTEDNSRESNVDIPANSFYVGTFGFTDTKGVGVRTGKVKVRDSQIFYDDELFFTYEVLENVGVLILNGDDSPPKYLEKLYGLDEYYKVSSQSISNVSQEEIFKSDLVVLNNVNNVSSGLVKNLQEFYNSGGSITIVPGKKPDLNSLNTLLQQLEMPNLGYQDSSSSRLSKLNAEDVLFSGVFKRIPRNINLPEVKKHYSFNTSSSSDFVSLMDFANGKSFFVRKLSGPGRIYVSSVPLDESFSNFPKHSIFIGVFLRIGEMSVRNNPLMAFIGSQSQYRFPTNSGDKEPVHLVNQKEGIDIIPLAQKKWNEELIFLGQGESTSDLVQGFYNVSKKEETLGKIALNFNRKESVLEFYSKEEIEKALKEKNISIRDFIDIKESADNFKIELNKSKEYWRILLILGLIFILIEILLIKFLKTST
ncbi:MAG: BatA domain-containing protein [Crocinitomicaceae bacterium]|nr:BatA domain-containing protein [Crocinitomicaceae bacterium]